MMENQTKDLLEATCLSKSIFAAAELLIANITVSCR